MMFRGKTAYGRYPTVVRNVGLWDWGPQHGEGPPADGGLARNRGEHKGDVEDEDGRRLAQHGGVPATVIRTRCSSRAPSRTWPSGSAGACDTMSHDASELADWRST